MASGNVPVLRGATRLTRVGVLPRPSPAGWRAVARLRDAFDETLPTLKLAPVGRRPRREPPVLQLVVPGSGTDEAGVPTPVPLHLTCELSGAAIELLSEPAATSVDFGDPTQPLDPGHFAVAESTATDAAAIGTPPSWPPEPASHTAPLSFVQASPPREPEPVPPEPAPRVPTRARVPAPWWLALGLVAVLSLALGSSLARQTMAAPMPAPAAAAAAPSMIVLPSPIIVTAAREPAAASPPSQPLATPAVVVAPAAVVATPAAIPGVAAPSVAAASPPLAAAPSPPRSAGRRTRPAAPRVAVREADDADEDDDADDDDDADADQAPVIATPSPAERALHDAERAFADGRHAAALVFARQALQGGAGPRAARIMALSGCVAGDADAVRRALASLPAGQHGSVRARCSDHGTVLP